MVAGTKFVVAQKKEKTNEYAYGDASRYQQIQP